MRCCWLAPSDIPGAGILATSSNNRFANVVEGLQLTVGGSSDAPVTIDVESTDESLVSNVKLLVTNTTNCATNSTA